MSTQKEAMMRYHAMARRAQQTAEPPQAKAVRRPPEAYHPERAPTQPVTRVEVPPTPTPEKTEYEIAEEPFKREVLEPIKAEARQAFETQLEYTLLTGKTEVTQKEAMRIYHAMARPITEARLERLRQEPTVQKWEAEQRAHLEARLVSWEFEQLETFLEQWKPPKPPSLAERILEAVKGPVFPQMRPTGLLTPPKWVFEPIKPLAGIAGFVAYPETFAYAGMTWVGVEPATMPPPHPSVHPEYGLGYGAAMVITTLLLGEAIARTPIGKAEAWAWKKVTQKWHAWRAPKPPTLEWQEPPPFISKEDYYRFYVQTTQAAGRPVPIGAFERPIALKPWKAWIKVPPTPEAGGLVTVHEWYPELTPTILRRVAFKPMITPFLMEVPKTYPTILPYVAGVGLVAMPTLAPKPVVTPKPIEIVKPKITPLPTQVPKIFEVPTVAAEVAAIQAPVVSQKQIQQQVQQQVQRTVQIQPSPTLLKAMKVPRWLDFEPPKRRRRRKEEPDLFGLYGRYKRFYPVMPPRKALKKLVGL